MARGSKKASRGIWGEKVEVAEAITKEGSMYYLVDENYEFIPVIKEYLDMIQSKATREVSPNTIRTYCYLLWYFQVFLYMNDLTVIDLEGRPEVLVKFKQWLKNPYRFYENIETLDNTAYYPEGSNLGVRTINAIINMVSSLYLWLKATNRIKENPVIYRKVAVASSIMDKNPLIHTKGGKSIQVNTLKSKVPVTISKIIGEKEFKLLLQSVKSIRDKIILIILKEGGLRAGELLGIRLEDIDFAEQGIWIRFRSDNINNARAKCGYGRDRFVHLPADLMVLIDRYISSEWIESNPNHDLLFVVINSKKALENGKPMKKSTLDSIFKYYGKRLGINIHPHQLRHTHVTELAQEYIKRGENINWEYISKRLGHVNVTTTMEIYAHLTKEDYKYEYIRLYKKEKVKGE
ncbi:tyrosine-type recombinase/integrase [Desnuesiella massiliensis]|uniref:tyrosine-type recombinase/integrase n=1 Tax=Desnuesiella massiliensis TaxID=1650662 RepID=UPI0006E17B3A|nr:tyrosine-type recombinase/integrase [Desnuesiella massiliensis]